MSLEEFDKLKESDPQRYKEGRQRSKPINFGVTLTLEEAQQFRERLIHEVYPELNDKDGYLANTSMAALASNLGVSEAAVWEVFDSSGKRNPLAARGVANVVRGVSTASESYQQRVWSGLCRLLNMSKVVNEEIAGLVGREQGGQRLHALLFWQSAATLTGRLRGGVGYTDGKNCPFQSLCADGAKRALWKLLYAGFDVYAFVHDEILVQLPAEDAAAKAEEVRQIMTSSMEAVMGHGVPAACDFIVADSWKKPS